MPYPFKQIFAVDPNNLDLVAADSEVLIFAPGDVSRTPLEITDLTGVPLSNPITTNEHGFGPAFIAELPQVAWEGGGLTGTMESYEGLRDEAVAAATSAMSAQASAGDAATSAANAASTAAAQVTTELDGALTAVQEAAADAAKSASLVGAPADDAMATVLGSENSQSRAALNPVFVRKGELVINVMDCGATGDGTTDDTAAFTLACTQARASKREVYVPAGKYYIPGEVDVSGVVIRGDLAGYYNRDGSVIIGDGSGITFNQVSTGLGSITMGLHGLRFENVETAFRLSYAVYSHFSDVSVIDATGPGIMVGDNSIIGPIWNHFERVKVSTVSVTEPALLLAGKDWCNNNIFDDCDFKGGTGPAVRVASTGGYGAINNIFNATEIRGGGVGVEFAATNVGTTLSGCYMESTGPSVWIKSVTDDLLLQANVYGSLKNTNPTGKKSFIHHEAGRATVRVAGGWITVADVADQTGLSFMGSAAVGSLTLRYMAEPVIPPHVPSNFKLHDPAVTINSDHIQRGNLIAQRASSPKVELSYADGSMPFTIRRNGSQGGADFGVDFSHDGVRVMNIANNNRLTFYQALATNQTAAASTLGTVTRRLQIRDELGAPIGYIPIYDNIT